MMRRKSVLLAGWGMGERVDHPPSLWNYIHTALVRVLN